MLTTVRRRNRTCFVRSIEQLEIRTLLAPGAFDPMFGNGGTFQSLQGTPGQVVKTDSLNRVVTAGLLNGDFAVARYTSAGALDTSFGAGGVVTTHFNSAATLQGMAIQPDDKVVVVGSIGGDVAVVRYEARGILDFSFRGTGIATRDLGGFADSAVDVKLQPDGRIVVAANASGGSTTASNVALLRYNSDGQLDTTFRNGGIQIYNTITAESGSFLQQASSLAIPPDGKYVVAGWVGNGQLQVGSNTRVLALRTFPDGALDSTFGNNGVAALNNVGNTYGALGTQVSVQPDGRLVVAGNYGGPTVPLPAQQSSQPVLLRLHTNGLLDTSFGGPAATDGLVFPEADANLALAGALGITTALQGNGQIVVAGYGRVVRLNIDGTTDTSFGTGGSTNTDVNGGVAVDGEQRIVFAGIPATFGQTLVYTVGRLDGDTIDRMYRVYLDPSHPGGDQHYFTTSAYEYLTLVQSGWNDETTGNPGFSVHSTAVAGSKPVHMLYNPNTSEHYYTLDSAERDILVSLGWQFQRDIGYMFPLSGGIPPAGTTEIYHLYNQKFGAQHVFTDSLHEVQTILAMFPDIWVQQTSLGYAIAGSTGNVFTPSASDFAATAGLVLATPDSVATAGENELETGISFRVVSLAGIASSPTASTPNPQEGTPASMAGTLQLPNDGESPEPPAPAGSLDAFWSMAEPLLT